MLPVGDKEALGHSRFAILRILRPTRAPSFPTGFFPQTGSMAKRELTGQLDFVVL